MKQMLTTAMTVCMGVLTLLHADGALRPCSAESVKALERMISSIEPPRIWPPNKWYVQAIPAFVASNGIPKEVYVATFEKVAEERIAKFGDPANKANKSAFGVGVAVCLNSMGDIGEKGLLPWLEKTSDESEWPDVRTRAAVNYVKIAGLAAVPFVKKILSEDRKDDFHCKYLTAKELFNQIELAEAQKGQQDKIDDAYKMLIGQAQETNRSIIAWELDKMLSQHLQTYEISLQRNGILFRFLQSTNEAARGNFTRKFNELQDIPKEQRTDLSHRFPELSDMNPENVEETEKPASTEDK